MFRRVIGWFGIAVIAIGVLSSCGEDSSDSVVVGVNDISNAEDAEDYLATVYNRFTSSSLFSDAFLIMPLLFSDEAVYTGSQNIHWKESSDFDITADNSVIDNIFTDFYSISASLNLLFNEIDTTEDVTLTEDIKNGFIGEGRAIRGILYYYLTSFWGEVPMLLDPDGSETESEVVNESLEDIFTQIESDLVFGAENISKNPYNTGNQRISEWTANAFLARLYLYNEDWANALEYAEKVINSNEFTLEANPQNIYNLYSSEHIWILPEDEDDISLAVWFLQTFAGGQHVVEPRENDFFESALDKRREVALNNTGSTIVKYIDAGSNNDPLYMVRLAEMHLIAAEAEGNLSNFGDAAIHLNTVRNRADLADVSLNSSNLDSLILQERRAELCYEGPHRWLDLKRLGKDVEELEEYGYTATDHVWPLSTFFIESFSNLEQNEGY